MKIKPKVDTATRKWLMTADSFKHPAKMNIPLLFWIVQKYTRPGDIVLDPMAGAGTTMLACWIGRNVILVELEEKFVKMCEANWQKLQQMPSALGFEMGWCMIKQGDARNLEGLLRDVVLTSPPYARQMPGGGGIAKEHEFNWKYGDMEGQIGNLPYEIADSIITSPPYAEAQSGGGIAKEGYKGSKHSPTDLVSKRTYMPENVGDHPENIAFLPYADAVITSPPYAESTHHSDDPHDTEKYRPSRSSRVAGTAGDSRDNIGQFPYVNGLERQTYLSEMLKVYQQCWKCLKPKGLLIIVVKNFIRNKRIVPLDEHTIILCRNAGFSLEERHYRELTSQSFWRIIYREKYPDAPIIDREEILVFQKLTNTKVDHGNQRNENADDS